MQIPERYKLNPVLYIRDDGIQNVLLARYRSSKFVDFFLVINDLEKSILQMLDCSFSLCDTLDNLFKSSVSKSNLHSTEIQKKYIAINYHEVISFLNFCVTKEILLIEGNEVLDKVKSCLFSSKEDAFYFTNKDKIRKNNRCNTPIYLSLMPTLKCELSCSYCYFKKDMVKEKDSLDFNKISEILDECERHEIFQIRLSGGEVLLYPKIFDLLRAIGKRNLFLGKPISTKLAISRKTLIELSEAGIVTLQYSIDTVEPGIFQKLHNLRSLKYCIQYTSKVQKSIQNAHKIGFKVIVRITVNRINLNSILKTIHKINQSSEISQFIISPEVSFDFHKSDGNFLTLLEMDKLSEDVSELKRLYSNTKFIIKFSNTPDVTYDSNNINRYKFNSKELFLQNSFCTGNNLSCTILPNGDVTYCSAVAKYRFFNMGNIYCKTLIDIWQSEKSNKLIKVSPDSGCFGCEFIKDCIVFSHKCYAYTMSTFGNMEFPDPRCYSNKFNRSALSATTNG